MARNEGSGQGRVRKYSGRIVHCPEPRCQNVIQLFGKGLALSEETVQALAVCPRGHKLR